MPIRKTRLLAWIIGFFLLLIGLFALYTWVSLTFSFSKGDRTGYIQKFSLKGWVCKTWEGELTMLPIPGMVPEKFIFSVRNDQLAKNINQTLGKKVVLSYEQHKGVPSSCFGESEYFVTAVRIIE